MSEDCRNTHLEWEEDEEVENVQRSGQRGKRSGSQGPGNWSFIEQEAFDATNGLNDGVARLAAQLHALQLEMQTLREQNQDQPHNMPESARQAQNDYVDPGITARQGRAHASMDCPSPTGSEQDR
eukprot:509460-Rhodomonas_salina.3